MKTIIVTGLTLLVSASAFSQELDDMYFRSKDREKVAMVNNTAQNQVVSSSYDTFKKKNFSDPTMLDEYTNPTDSYSARNVNPEFIARSNSAQAAEDEMNYFTESYNGIPTASTFSNANLRNSWNSNAWNNPMYSPGWFGPSWNNSFYSPYWGWNNPWANPYWCGTGFNPGWSMSMSYFWGNSWNPGWSMGIGYTWGNPFMGSMWGPSWGGMWGPSWGMMNPWFNRPVVIVSDAARPNYGKRPTTSNAGVNNITSRPVNARPTTPTISDSSNPLGRQRTTTSDEYYVRPSRRMYSESGSFSTPNPTNSGNNSRVGSTGSTGTRTYNSTPSRSFDTNRSSGSYSSPSRSMGSSSGSFSTPSRSSSGSSGSSGVRRGNN
ncbi:MAG: hypothetical protein MUE95_00620 [Cyclobacteriaceae bacterium]|nr:hypothetical protein [Cyclobacteriaceae bacterium]